MQKNALGATDNPESKDQSTKRAKMDISSANPALEGPLLTDLYQITMAYAYWQMGKHEDKAVFDLYFRKSPFGGEYAIFCGLDECLRFLSNYRFSPEHIAYLQSVLPHCTDKFWQWLSQVDASSLKVYALREGSVCFPHIPLLRVEGPIAIAQLIETPLLCLINYATLVATNAARYRVAAGGDKTLIEMGLRRAHGPDGGLSASRYTYIGGFDATSNVLAGMKFGIEVRGTHAHAFVSSFRAMSEVRVPEQFKEMVSRVQMFRKELDYFNSHEGELAAFTAYAICYPDNFLALVDTYDTVTSGVPNFLCVALALASFGYTPKGIRLDSGDLAYLSRRARAMFKQVGLKYNLPHFALFTIVASNDINEETLVSLRSQSHEVNAFGVGTHLVTCSKQSALGGVYKLVELGDTPRMKISQETSKITIPCRKDAYRLVGNAGYPVVDVLVRAGVDAVPVASEPFLCRNPFDESKRALVKPAKVLKLHELVWDGHLVVPLQSAQEVKAFAKEQLDHMREDHIRWLNPTPYPTF